MMNNNKKIPEKFQLEFGKSEKFPGTKIQKRAQINLSQQIAHQTQPQPQPEVIVDEPDYIPYYAVFILLSVFLLLVFTHRA